MPLPPHTRASVSNFPHQVVPVWQTVVFRNWLEAWPVYQGFGSVTGTTVKCLYQALPCGPVFSHLGSINQWLCRCSYTLGNVADAIQPYIEIALIPFLTILQQVKATVAGENHIHGVRKFRLGHKQLDSAKLLSRLTEMPDYGVIFRALLFFLPLSFVVMYIGQWLPVEAMLSAGVVKHSSAIEYCMANWRYHNRTGGGYTPPLVFIHTLVAHS